MSSMESNGSCLRKTRTGEGWNYTYPTAWTRINGNSPVISVIFPSGTFGGVGNPTPFQFEGTWYLLGEEWHQSFARPDYVRLLRNRGDISRPEDWEDVGRAIPEGFHTPEGLVVQADRLYLFVWNQQDKTHYIYMPLDATFTCWKKMSGPVDLEGRKSPQPFHSKNGWLTVFPEDNRLQLIAWKSHADEGGDGNHDILVGKLPITESRAFD